MLIVFPKPRRAYRHPAFLTEERIALTAKLDARLPNPSEAVAVIENKYKIVEIRNKPVVKLLWGRPKIRYRSVKWAKDVLLSLVGDAIQDLNTRVKPIQVLNALRSISVQPTYTVVITNRKVYTLDTVPRSLTVERFLLWGYVLFLFA